MVCLRSFQDEAGYIVSNLLEVQLIQLRTVVAYRLKRTCGLQNVSFSCTEIVTFVFRSLAVDSNVALAVFQALEIKIQK